MNGISSLEDLLKLSEDDLEKIGLNKEQIEQLNNKLQNYLSKGK